MLYVSTRNRTDAFTAYRVLHEDKAPDGGLFVPHRLPILGKEELASLQKASFGSNVASILNIFFSADLSGWDVDFSIGRHCCRLIYMSHRLNIAELWHNHRADFRFVEKTLYNKLCGGDTSVSEPTEWVKIAIRIAVLFGIFAELGRNGIQKADIAVPSGDFAIPMAAWYAKKMGLPIGTIICSCNENGSLWDLFHRGEFSTGTAKVNTSLPELDVVCPTSLERLIYETLGRNEVGRYLDICKKRGTYLVDEVAFGLLCSDFVSAVVSGVRCRSVIRSIYRTHDYITDPYTAVAYGGLQDYRAHTGESCPTLLMVDRSPMVFQAFVAEAIGISGEEMRKRIHSA